MASPMLLVVQGGNEPIDHLKELANATKHLGLDINPDGTWEEALLRVRMIGKISHQRVVNVIGEVVNLPTPQFNFVNVVGSGLTFSPDKIEIAANYTLSITIPSNVEVLDG